MSKELTEFVQESALFELATFDQFAKHMAKEDIAVVKAEEFGDGFNVVEKVRLLGEKFYILGFRFHQGNHGEFVIVHVVGEKLGKAIINDGSTGIYKQLRAVADAWKAGKGKPGPILVENGLAVSKYDYVNADGETSAAETYYISGM